MDGAYVRYMPVISAVVAGATTLAPARAALETVLGRQAKGSTGGPDEAARSLAEEKLVDHNKDW